MKHSYNPNDDIMASVMKKYQFTEGSKIGKGTFGNVIEITINKNSNKAALKCFFFSKKKNKDGSEEFVNKNTTLSKVRKEGTFAVNLCHTNIIRGIGTITKEKEDSCFYGILMEKASYGSLEKVLYHLRNRNIFSSLFDLNKTRETDLNKAGETLSCFFFSQIVSGLQFLLRKKICHLDLKPNNVLLTIGLICKICDFGLATTFEKIETFRLPESTKGFMGPEYFSNGRNVTKEQIEKVDIFSLGMVLYYILCGETPNQKDLERKESLEEKVYPLIEKIKVSDDAKNLLKQMLSPVDSRLDIYKVYLNKWVQNKKSKMIKKVYDSNESESIKIISEIKKLDYFRPKNKKKKIINKIKFSVYNLKVF